MKTRSDTDQLADVSVRRNDTITRDSDSVTANCRTSDSALDRISKWCPDVEAPFAPPPGEPVDLATEAWWAQYTPADYKIIGPEARANAPWWVEPLVKLWCRERGLELSRSMRTDSDPATNLYFQHRMNDVQAVSDMIGFDSSTKPCETPFKITGDKGDTTIIFLAPCNCRTCAGCSKAIEARDTIQSTAILEPVNHFVAEVTETQWKSSHYRYLLRNNADLISFPTIVDGEKGRRLVSTVPIRGDNVEIPAHQVASVIKDNVKRQSEESKAGLLRGRYLTQSGKYRRRARKIKQAEAFVKENRRNDEVTWTGFLPSQTTLIQLQKTTERLFEGTVVDASNGLEARWEFQGLDSGETQHVLDQLNWRPLDTLQTHAPGSGTYNGPPEEPF